MARESFRVHIKELEKDILQIGDMVINAVNRSIDALKNRDINEAQKIVKDDAIVNNKRWTIEEKCIQLIALQQPVASDLREIVSMLSIVTDIERIGDYAEGIAKIVVLLGTEPPVKPLVHIPKMAEIATSMLKRSLDAFIQRDAKTAVAICNEDDQVDKLYDQVYHNLLNLMIEDPSKISKATPLIWAAHNVERIADRVTNICERTVYLASGKLQQINTSNY